MTIHQPWLTFVGGMAAMLVVALAFNLIALVEAPQRTVNAASHLLQEPDPTVQERETLPERRRFVEQEEDLPNEFEERQEGSDEWVERPARRRFIEREEELPNEFEERQEGSDEWVERPGRRRFVEQELELPSEFEEELEGSDEWVERPARRRFVEREEELPNEFEERQEGSDEWVERPARRRFVEQESDPEEEYRERSARDEREMEFGRQDREPQDERPGNRWRLELEPEEEFEFDEAMVELQYEQTGIESNIGRLELITRLSEIAESDTAVAGFAIMHLDEFVEVDESADILSELLESEAPASVKNLARMKLVQVYAELDRRDDVRNLLREMLKLSR